MLVQGVRFDLPARVCVTHYRCAACGFITTGFRKMTDGEIKAESEKAMREAEQRLAEQAARDNDRERERLEYEREKARIIESNRRRGRGAPAV